MEWTTGDILTLVGLIITFAVALGGWIVSGRKAESEREKTEAETASIYAKLAADGANREKAQKAENERLEQAIDRQGARIEAQARRIEAQDKEISVLKALLDAKDRRIEELESLTAQQEKEIKLLRAELDSMKNLN